MKRSIVEWVMFFFAMNFLGVVTAVGVMVVLGKLNSTKLKDLQLIALDEAVIVKPEKIKEYEELKEKYSKLKKEEEARSKHDGMVSSGEYDIQIKALQKRETENKNYDSQIKKESETVLERWREVTQMLEEIKKRQAEYAQERKEDIERSKSDKLKILLKRYDTMEAINVAMALINTDKDPKLEKPKILENEEDPRVKEAAFYLKEMKPARSAEILEAMGPLWTNALQKYMEKMPIAENIDSDQPK